MSFPLALHPIANEVHILRGSVFIKTELTQLNTALIFKTDCSSELCLPTEKAFDEDRGVNL
jgi:hypothetical protein